MRRTLAGLGAVVAAVAGVAGATGSAAADEGSRPPAGAAAPARMLVTAQEFSLMQSRMKLPRGHAVVQLYNRGEDPHDLVARRVARRGRVAGRTLRIAETRPGEVGEATWKLRRGRYKLWCSLPGHRAAGMRGQLRVR